MADTVYEQLRETMAKRGGMYPGLALPEFYALVSELFTAQEAAVNNALPQGLNTAPAIAAAAGMALEEITPILEEMAGKGLLFTLRKGDHTLYGGMPFVPGIFEYQFMRGTRTAKDKKLAQLIQAYKAAVDRQRRPRAEGFPVFRVIPVNRSIATKTQVHTYDQVKAYIENAEPLAVGTCYCRHQARLIDEDSHCGSPDDVCLQFGAGAQFVIDRGIGRQINKQEALEVLERSEAAGLVHCTNNRQDIDFLCNCCPCHCVILKHALALPKPARALNSGFQPRWHEERCGACEICLERCPVEAVSFDADVLRQHVDLDLCIGCGVCASGCPEEALEMVPRADAAVPPADRKALKAAVKASPAF